MIEAGTNTEANREITKNDASKQAIMRARGKRKKKRNRYSLINSSNCRYDLVRFTATKFSIKESLENWNIYWTDLSISVQRCKEMKRFQRINHFPGMMEICRKDLLARNLNRLYKTFPEDYNVFPRTWCLPTDMAEVTEYAKTHKGKCFIVKPDQGCQGRGIAITKNINQLKTYDRMICQQYIQRPFLIDGFKFDLRIYVLISSCDPMRLFVYNEGLARFATAKYKEPNILNASNMYMHLTNYSVNKHSRTYIVDDIDGSKRKLSTINMWFQKNNYDVQKIWDSIDDVIIKTMIVSLPTLKHYYHTCFPNHSTSHACFEILGFDFMFDYRLKPYVLEVNHSPSFNTETTIDHEVKESLLYDTFNILNLQHNNRFKVLIEDKKRARDRLFSVTHSPEILSREKAHEDRISQHRIEWENNHLGNYRKIYPGKRDEYYEKFIGARQNTMYAETVSSKAKEAVPKVGEQAGPSRVKVKKLKLNVQDGTCPVKAKVGGGDGPVKEETKIDEAPETPSEDIKSDELHKSIDKAPGLDIVSSITSDKKQTKLKTVTNEEENEPMPSVLIKPIVLPAEPEKINEADERERLSNMKKREFLIKSHGILEKVYENLKNAGLLKLETDIKDGRSNKWEASEEGKTYIAGYQKFNKSMVQVLDCITKKVELRELERDKSGDLLPDAGLGLDRLYTTIENQKFHSVSDDVQLSNPKTRLDFNKFHAINNQKSYSTISGAQSSIPNTKSGFDRHRVIDDEQKAQFSVSRGTQLLFPSPRSGYIRPSMISDLQKPSLVSSGTQFEEMEAPSSQDEISKKTVTTDILELSPNTAIEAVEKKKSHEEILTKQPMTVEVLDCVAQKPAMKTTEKVKSREDMPDYALALDRPRTTLGLQKSNLTYSGRRFEFRSTGKHEPGSPKRPPGASEAHDRFSRKMDLKPPRNSKSGETLPESLLKIDRPFTSYQKSNYSTSGRRYEVSEDFSRKPPTVEVVTPYVRRTTADRLFERDKKTAPQGAKGSPGNPVLKIGHFGKPEAWGSLEEYFERKKLLNRAWQNTDV